MDMNTLFDMPRRDILCTLEMALTDDDILSDVAGKNTLVDCTLYLIAKGDREKEKNLQKHLSVRELLMEIDHVNDQKSIRNKRKELLKAYAGF